MKMEDCDLGSRTLGKKRMWPCDCLRHAVGTRQRHGTACLRLRLGVSAAGSSLCVSPLSWSHSQWTCTGFEESHGQLAAGARDLPFHYFAPSGRTGRLAARPLLSCLTFLFLCFFVRQRVRSREPELGPWKLGTWKH